MKEARRAGKGAFSLRARDFAARLVEPEAPAG
jgi:hypothetical protein